jgi:cytochrome c peroxidase
VPTESSALITANGDFALLGNTAAPVKVPCNLNMINSLDNTTGNGPSARLAEAFSCGDDLFSDVFNELDGIGARVGQGRRFTRYPRADLNGPGEWNQHTPPRITGPNAQACSDCHGAPGDGAGGIQTHAVRDPNFSGLISQFIERQTPHLFGLFALQRVAEEMTDDMHAQAVAAGVGHSVTFQSKGVTFGTSTVTSINSTTGAVTIAPALVSIDSDLVVKPFQWKGNTTFVRDFVRGAAHNEIGMQATEMAGQNIDGDADGVINELTVGDMSAFSAYMGTQIRPVTTIELNQLGLLTTPLSAQQIADINNGSTVFNMAGCNGCHTPMHVLNNPVAQEPSASPFYRDGATFPEGTLNPLSVGVDPSDPISANLITDLVDNRQAFPNNLNPSRTGDLLGGLERNRAQGAPAGSALVRAFTDMRRHFMGANLAEQIADGGIAPAVWMTRSIWGIATTAPYMHDGRATTLMSAILEHSRAGDTPASEAAASVNFVRNSSQLQQRQLIAFLNSMVLFLPD